MDSDGAQMDNDEALRVLTERLRRPEDLEEIRQLYTEYGRWCFALRRGLIDVGLLGPQTLGQNPPG